MLRSFANQSRNNTDINIPRGLAIICAFNYMKDPQRHIEVKGSYKYIKSWYESIQKYPAMDGLVFETMFNESFRETYETEQVQFYHIDPTTHPSFEGEGLRRTPNDQRFIALDWYLRNGFADEYDYVLITDGSDVTFHRNPFVLMDSTDRAVDDSVVYVQSETYSSENTLRWMTKRWKKCLNQDYPLKASKFYNCGILGGAVEEMKHLLSHITKLLLEKTPLNEYCDMVVVQHAVQNLYDENVFTGFPLHSKFNSFEDNTKACIQHK